jgi:hypothetical protein
MASQALLRAVRTLESPTIARSTLNTISAATDSTARGMVMKLVAGARSAVAMVNSTMIIYPTGAVPVGTVDQFARDT